VVAVVGGATALRALVTTIIGRQVSVSRAVLRFSGSSPTPNFSFTHVL
jgi:hypothetical protein